MTTTHEQARLLQVSWEWSALVGRIIMVKRYEGCAGGGMVTCYQYCPPTVGIANKMPVQNSMALGV